ncbi:hypothetical protein [Phytohabitans houttuyneae]|uniref:Uncharacterized protein n=1 Tax=Phytohabitans houttuyneae TaxID=1076126 RepID=A0A6V8K4C8_9ACTN|nr:hypothetical protein [Phytohabitans houttuyneae]GFJ77251.1 hypothetical protein Phou_014310 [Phytohabitans houttuyneae]
MIKSIARASVFVACAAICAILTYPTWRSMLAPAPTELSPSDSIVFVFPPDGRSGTAKLTIPGATGVVGARREWIGGENVDSEPHLWFERPATPASAGFVIASGRFVAPLAECADESARSLSVAGDMPTVVAAVSEEISKETRNAKVFALSPVDGHMRISCRLPRETLWTQVRQKHYLTVPDIYVARYFTIESDDEIAIHEEVVRIRRNESLRDCVSIQYVTGRRDRVEVTEAYATEEPPAMAGAREWKSCGDGQGNLTSMSAFRMHISPTRGTAWAT